MTSGVRLASNNQRFDRMGAIGFPGDNEHVCKASDNRAVATQTPVAYFLLENEGGMNEERALDHIAVYCHGYRPPCVALTSGAKASRQNKSSI